MRLVLGAMVLAVTFMPGSRLGAAIRDGIISEPAAAQHGMARPWGVQIEMDRSRSRVRDMALYEGTLYVQTNRANISALDAETGHQLWAKVIGRPDFPSVPLVIDGDLLATINGSEIYVCNRYNGELLYQNRIAGSPNGSPALSDDLIFVPTAAGAVLAYRLELQGDARIDLGTSKRELSPEEKVATESYRRANLRLRQDHNTPTVCQSKGRACVQPLVVRQDREEEIIAWPTDRGVLSVARVDRRDLGVMTLKYEVRTDAAILAKLAYLPPDPKVRGDVGVLFATSTNGYIYAVSEKRGDMLWKYPTSEPLYQPPAVVDDHIFVVSQLGGMFCCQARTGKQLWWVPEVMQFVAVSKQRVYAADRAGRTQVFDLKTGTRLDVLSTELLPIKLFNSQTDRLYLVTDTGLVQCLHEIEQTKPILHGEDRKLQPVEEPEKHAVKKPKGGGEHAEPKPRPTPKPKAPPGDKPAKAPKNLKDKPAKKGAKAVKEDEDAGAAGN